MNQPLLQWWHFSVCAAEQQQKQEQKFCVQQSRSKNRNRNCGQQSRSKKLQRCSELPRCHSQASGGILGSEVGFRREGELEFTCLCCLSNKTHPVRAMLLIFMTPHE